jgi:predicted transcriptional regulator
MIRTQISMTEEQADALRRLAAVRRRSQAALLREALDQYLAAATDDTRYERARAVVGAFRGGAGNVAVEHDAALDEAYRT